MKRIAELSGISAAVSAHFVKNVFTNNFLTEESYLSEINAGSLYAVETDNGLYVLREREDFYILNFHIHGEASLPEALNGKRIVVEIPYKGKEQSFGFFESSGFEPFLERMRMTGKKAEHCGGRGSFLKEDTAEEAYSLLKANFNKYTGCIPDFDVFLKDIRNKRVMAYSEDGIKGILHFSVKGKGSEIRHLAVAEKERNRGIAGELIKAYHAHTNCSKYQVWLAKNNTPAENLYKKHGYERDGFQSVVYTKGI